MNKIRAQELKRINCQTKEARALAISAFDGNKAKAQKWMKTPTSLFFDQTPLEVICAGEGAILLQFLKTRTGKASGAAF